MSTQLIEGQDVTLLSARGHIRRTIVKLVGDVIVVGSKADYEHAKTAGISQFSVGFRLSDVIAENQLDTTVSLKHNVQYEPAEHGQASPNPLDAL